MEDIKKEDLVVNIFKYIDENVSRKEQRKFTYMLYVNRVCKESKLVVSYLAEINIEEYENSTPVVCNTYKSLKNESEEIAKIEYE